MMRSDRAPADRVGDVIATRSNARVPTASGMLLVRPCSLAGHRSEGLAAAVFSLALALVVVFELATPNDVVATIGFLPLTAAMWSLSSRYAALVGVLALGCFVLIFISETGNRPTVMYIGATGLALSLAVRWYATRLVLEPGTLSPLAWPGFRIPHSGLFEALTRRELEVARLAAGGWSASEIGLQLHISERTVESHLANTYAKLGIHSRSALRQVGATNRDQ